MSNYLSIDIGTTSTKCFLFSERELLASSQVETSLITPHSGWVEQDPMEIFYSVIECFNLIAIEIKEHNLDNPIRCGITNQRETIVTFRKSTGETIGNALSWMDVRTSHQVEELKTNPQKQKYFEEITGLKASTFFSAFKIKWIMENVSGAQKAAEQNDLAFATIDSWILWKLTNGGSFYTDPSNASRTFLLDIKTCDWSSDLLDYFGIKRNWLPEIKLESSDFGRIAENYPFSDLPITVLIGDQQSSLIGHWGAEFEGKAKCTFGTGAFLLRSLGNPFATAITHPDALRTVIIPNQFAEEYPIVCAGSLIKWLQKSLNFFTNPRELNSLNFTPQSPEESVYFIPDMSGCLFPFWDPSARGSFHNISLQCGKTELILAVLESIAFCVRRALETEKIEVLSVDGGMCTNPQFCQLLANVCNCHIRHLNNSDATGLGVAVLVSKFKVTIDLKPEIITPQRDLTLVYNQKYSHWLSLQSQK